MHLYFRRRLFVILCTTALAMSVNGEARAWTPEVFQVYLDSGQWRGKAEDNIDGEKLPISALRDVVRKYCQTPTNKDALEDLGIIALTLGVAHWGIGDPVGLPADPAGKDWKSTTGHNRGKSLMSYANSGVGISHFDVGDLQVILRRWAEQETHADRKARLTALANEVRYRKDRTRTGKRIEPPVYDEIRAAGVCNNAHDTDLDGEKFDHRPESAKESYCISRKNKQLSRDDWRLFRTVARNKLRNRAEQEWLLDLWMRNYWHVSLKAVHPGRGYTDEAIINVRLRNSGSGYARRGIAPRGLSPDDRIEHELKAYGDAKPETLARRREIMMRPVNLYRYMAASLKAENIDCPN